MRTKIAASFIAAVLICCAVFVAYSTASAQTTVCTMTGLTGAAEQENLLYCATNQITNTTTNAAASTYPAAIQLAQTKHVIVGTPMSVSQTVDWVGTPITYVEFSSGFHAEHFNPSNNHVRIYDQYDRLVFED